MANEFIVEKEEKIDDYNLRIKARSLVAEERKRKLKENFQGEILLIANPEEFVNRFEKYIARNNMAYKAKLVKYDDFSVNNRERMDSHNKEKSLDYLFWKDDTLSFQQEYRIVITSELNRGPVKHNIGDISDLTMYLDLSELLDEGLSIEMTIKKEKL
ncbi:hypothetical protein [Lentibacillus daqui]|uniref:hypothetical protein n=1 Tax=Lentibacillus daqui TaxID=2911514 RepID=UPI0022B1B0E9|nr:hypothetical protein [Lentibacillus daqui]